MYDFNDLPMDDGMSGAMSGLLGAYSIFMLIVLVIMIVSYWVLFQKANKPGWAAIIPIYNMIVLLEVVGLSWYWIFIVFAIIVPIIGGLIVLAFSIYLNYLLAKSFGKDVGFTIGLVLLPIIFLPILAFDKKIEYKGPAAIEMKENKNF